MTDTQPKPAPVKGGAVPYLSIDGAAKAVEFYKKAFGAELAMMQPVDDKGRTMHAHL
jgi:PhnB protein